MYVCVCVCVCVCVLCMLVCEKDGQVQNLGIRMKFSLLLLP
jgi:hypothetical protein